MRIPGSLMNKHKQGATRSYREPGTHTPIVVWLTDIHTKRTVSDRAQRYSKQN
jgi:hypothetical protein